MNASLSRIIDGLLCESAVAGTCCVMRMSEYGLITVNDVGLFDSELIIMFSFRFIVILASILN